MILVTKTSESPEMYSLHLDSQKPEDGVGIQGRELLMRPDAVLAFAVEKVNALLSPKAPATLPASLESGPLP